MEHQHCQRLFLSTFFTMGHKLTIDEAHILGRVEKIAEQVADILYVETIFKTRDIAKFRECLVEILFDSHRFHNFWRQSRFTCLNFRMDRLPSAFHVAARKAGWNRLGFDWPPLVCKLFEPIERIDIGVRSYFVCYRNASSPKEIR